MEIVDWSLRQFLLFVLVFFRVCGLFVMAPFFRSAGIPAAVLIGFGAITAVLVMPVVALHDPVLPTELGGFTVAILGEATIGYLLGYVASLIFTAAELAGLFVGQQMGLTIANVIDPVSGVQQSLLGQVKHLFAMLLFLAVNAHHVLIVVLADSFRVIPPLGCRFPDALARTVAFQHFSTMLDAAVRMSAPALVALLMVTVAMALVARTVPEVNIFIIGFGLRIIVGVVILLVSVPMLGRLLRAAFDRIDGDLRLLVHLMS